MFDELALAEEQADERAEERFRARQTAIFLEKHKDADFIVVDIKTKEPVEAQYFNKTSLAYHDREMRGFFTRLREKEENDA